MKEELILGSKLRTTAPAAFGAWRWDCRSFLFRINSLWIRLKLIVRDEIRSFHLEMGFFALALVGLNWPLLHGSCNTALIFMPEPVRHGEWWRVAAHPFIHVTWFHLLLDGTAFFLLYNELREHGWKKRAVFGLASGAGSLLVPLWAEPMLAVNGLCGLSGIAHGLMAVSALEMVNKSQDVVLRRLGLFSFLLLLFKCLAEALSGKMLFSFLYFGLVGEPIAVTHAGGLLGGAVAWLFMRLYYRAPKS